MTSLIFKAENELQQKIRNLDREKAAEYYRINLKDERLMEEVNQLLAKLGENPVESIRAADLVNLKKMIQQDLVCKQLVEDCKECRNKVCPSKGFLVRPTVYNGKLIFYEAFCREYLRLLAFRDLAGLLPKGREDELEKCRRLNAEKLRKIVTELRKKTK